VPRFERTFDSNNLSANTGPGSEWKSSVVYSGSNGPSQGHEKFD